MWVNMLIDFNYMLNMLNMLNINIFITWVLFVTNSSNESSYIHKNKFSFYEQGPLQGDHHI